MRVVTAEQMRQVEKNALAYDLTYARLMENAGSAAAAFIRRILSSEGRNCIIFCGKGNNGGDGYVTARKLHEQGAHVIVVLSEEKPQGLEASAMLSMLDVLKVPVLSMAQHAEQIKEYTQHADIVVDAIYGIGFHGSLSPLVKQSCDYINNSIAAVVALDLPSGVEADTGRVAAGAVMADFTVAFDSLKPLHIYPSSLTYCGHVEALSIGIPAEAYKGIPSLFQSIDEALVWRTIPLRDPESHKGTYGKVLSLCGSPPYRGAAVLSTLAALRTGAGICCIAAIDSVCTAVVHQVPEATLLPLPETEGLVDVTQAKPLLAPHLSDSQSILFGCGSGDNKATKALLEYLLTVSTAPMVLDADAINLLANNLDLLHTASAPIVLTPHPGEMARLCHCSVAEVQKNRHLVALEFARKYKVYVVLKGHETLVATPQGQVFRNHTGNPGLAKGGSGDILAGMIASLIAQGISPVYAALCGVWLHGKAADRCAKRLSQYSMLPSDILTDLGQLFLENKR